MRFEWRLPSLLGFLILTQISLSADGQVREPYKMRGIVVNRNDGAPVRRCHLVAGPTGRDRDGNGDSSQVTADTDDGGSFALSVPTSGRWLLRASCYGYRQQAFDEHDGFSSAVVLTQQQPTIELVFRLTPDATISGFVLDEANEPIGHAQISLHLANPVGVDNSQSLRNHISTTTDDRGHYELADLGPGNYRVSVQAKPWYATVEPTLLSPQWQTPADPSLDVVYPVTWFPGVVDPELAATLTLKGGENRQADFQFQPVPSVHLRIPVSALIPRGSRGEMVRFPHVQSVPFGIAPANLQMKIDGQGQVDVGGLTPGLYRVQFPDGPSQRAHVDLIQIVPGNPTTLDLSTAAVTATVQIRINGVEGSKSIPTRFVDAENLENVFVSTSREMLPAVCNIDRTQIHRRVKTVHQEGRGDAYKLWWCVIDLLYAFEV